VVTTIPVPIQFSLPEGWRSVPPDEVEAPEAAFVALRPPPLRGFTANITISGELHDAGVPLTTIADNVIEKLRTGAPDVELGRRNEVGSAESPGLTQAIRMTVDLHGTPTQIGQFQVFLALRDTGHPQRRAVLHIVLSALPEQLEELLGDFQQFVSTIRPEGDS
jgi:hypothetical protein